MKNTRTSALRVLLQTSNSVNALFCYGAVGISKPTLKKLAKEKVWEEEVDKLYTLFCHRFNWAWAADYNSPIRMRLIAKIKAWESDSKSREIFSQGIRKVIDAIMDGGNWNLQKKLYIKSFYETQGWSNEDSVEHFQQFIWDSARDCINIGNANPGMGRFREIDLEDSYNYTFYGDMVKFAEAAFDKILRGGDHTYGVVLLVLASETIYKRNFPLIKAVFSDIRDLGQDGHMVTQTLSASKQTKFDDETYRWNYLGEETGRQLAAVCNDIGKFIPEKPGRYPEWWDQEVGTNVEYTKGEREGDNETIHLKLSGLGLVDLPKSLPALEWLNSLDLSKNNLSRLPVELLQHPRLESLKLSKNPLPVNNFLTTSRQSKFDYLQYMRDVAAWRVEDLIARIEKDEQLDLVDKSHPELGSYLGLLNEKLDTSQSGSWKTLAEILSQRFEVELERDGHHFRLML